MKWTQRHSQNAVAAKARKRMQEPTFESERRLRMPRIRTKAKWRIQIRDEEHGDSLTLTLYRLPWPARYVDGDNQEHSARSLGRGIATLLTHAA
jgi:hypothetical protein